MPKLKELALYIKTKGVRASLLRIFHTYFKVNHFVLFKCDLSADLISDPRIEKPFEIREFDSEAIATLRSQYSQLPREFGVDKTHGGRRCFIAFNGEKIAHIQWVFYSGEYSKFFIFSNKDIAEINYIKTMDEFVGNRLQARTINHICHVLKSEGARLVVSAVAETNVLSISAMKRSCLSPFAKTKLMFGYAQKVTV